VLRLKYLTTELLLAFEEPNMAPQLEVLDVGEVHTLHWESLSRIIEGGAWPCLQELKV